MANEHRALGELKRCMKAANGDPKKMADCQTTFEGEQGTSVEGGKVFVAPDGNSAFVTTGGKVFNGGKVF